MSTTIYKIVKAVAVAANNMRLAILMKDKRTSCSCLCSLCTKSDCDKKQEVNAVNPSEGE